MFPEAIFLKIKVAHFFNGPWCSCLWIWLHISRCSSLQNVVKVICYMSKYCRSCCHVGGTVPVSFKRLQIYGNWHVGLRQL